MREKRDERQARRKYQVEHQGHRLHNLVEQYLKAPRVGYSVDTLVIAWRLPGTKIIARRKRV